MRIPVNKVKKERVKKVRLYFIILRFFHDHGQKLALNTVEPPLIVTSLQRPLFLADSPYIDSCLNLSTTATFFCPQGGRFGEVQLYIEF